MVAFMRYYHNKSIQLLFLGRVDIMMKFVVFLDVDGVLNTRTTVKRTPSDYTESMMRGSKFLQTRSKNVVVERLYFHQTGKIWIKIMTITNISFQNWHSVT